MRKTTAFATAVAVALSLAACGGGDEPSAGTAEEPRTIEITARDDLRFEPGSVTVRAGETVRFIVTNAGQIVHDFFVGTEDEQMEHEPGMAEMGGMGHGDAETLTIQPGETAELTMTLEEPGALLYGCHQPGHYVGGMVGTITVS